jgi:Arc/MetJ-type ribon-helix-helix transcriptional regulator
MIMSPRQRLTTTLPTEMAALVKAALSEGAYASSSAVIRAALRDWELKTGSRRRKVEALGHYTTTSEIVVARILHGARGVEALSEGGGITL